jgi:hypothetical protein
VLVIKSYVQKCVKITKGGGRFVCGNEPFNAESVWNNIPVKGMSISTHNFKIVFFFQACPFEMCFRLISLIIEFFQKCWKRGFSLCIKSVLTEPEYNSILLQDQLFKHKIKPGSPRHADGLQYLSFISG